MIEKVRIKHAPDKRVDIFNISARNGVLTGETNLVDAKDELLSSLNNQDYLDSIELLQPRYGLVNVSVGNIRSEPRHASELATQALMGMTLRIYKLQDNWHYVQTPDGYLGWLDDGAFVALTDAEYHQWQKAAKIVVSQPLDFIYQQKDKSIVSDVIEGNILELKERIDPYYRIRLPDGRDGMIKIESVVSYDDFLTLKEPLLENILTSAKQYMGRPYLWGGTSGKGVDCSGFTKTVFYLNALELPRDASQQVHTGVAVETDTTLRNLLPGDFIFFGQKANEKQLEKITHVAIYLGDGKIIHASERVQIQSLKREDPDFAEKRLLSMVRAKRMLQNIGENGVRKLADHQYYN
jgi:SH3-like domain-containing protein